MDKVMFIKSERGVPQEGPISPLLANIVLNELDQELEKWGYRFVRYCDDFMIFTKSKRATQRQYERVIKFIEGKLKLKVNKDKTNISKLIQVKYLGYSFYRIKGKCRFRVHPESINRLKDKLREVGDIVEGEIVDISHEGGGIVKVNNFTIFLDSELIGDVVKFKVTKLKKSYGMGKVLNIIKSSNYRIKPKCNVSNRCDGCQFQSYDYKAQLEWKREKVKNDLVKIAGLEGIKVNDTIGMDYPYRYRNNVQIPVAISKGKPLYIDTNKYYEENIYSKISYKKIEDIIKKKY